ncbi:MAG: methyltransferase domain-containing protein [Actinobacteria bacterium]|nr:methyltransferase domain-containing protein [Actinomycetota bacterium]
MTELREEVRRHYAEAATTGCCGGESCGDDAPAGSLGCGNPLAVAELHEGETVLDLGSGGGLEVIQSAKRVGPGGVAFGLDMTDEMLELAQRNAAEAGIRNAIFLRGLMEDIPLPTASVDVVISNCVVNLSTDKPAVLREIARVLKPGGRIGISDIVAEDRLSPEERVERGSYVGCIAGALSTTEFADGLEQAGFSDVTVEPTQDLGGGMHSAIVKAVKP